MRLLFLALSAFLAAESAYAGDGNRLTYLDEPCNPYYVSRTFPKLITPQWVGEEGVEAVVILAIDDMRGHEKWEAYLRPILNRLKKIDGRAPVSIMTCQIDPKDPHLQTWLKEGVSLETHTYDHPCPLLQGGDFAKAKATYDRAVDLLSEVPNSHPVAFRTPCCDSLNTVSPRLYAEIFNKTTAKGNFLTLDSSVFNLITANDPDLPRDLVLESNGTERFRKYLPADRTFVNYIEDYPYPYVIGGKCWEFPCVVPSDWSAQHYHKQNASPITLRDWKAALDATVIKKGVFNLVFHPHGWSKPEQIIDLIDHAVTKHGKKVKFLTFREAEERLNKNVLDGHPLRDSNTGKFNGVRVVGAAGGYVGVSMWNDNQQVMRRDWKNEGGKWVWKSMNENGRTVDDQGPFKGYKDVGWVHVGRESLMVGRGIRRPDYAVFRFSDKAGTYVKTGWTLPPGARSPDGNGDHGLRFIDIDEDGNDDVVFSNEQEHGVYLFTDMEHGWSKKVIAGKAGDKDALPPISVNGKNNGFFVHSRSLWWQNEHTNLLKDLVDRRSFNDLLMNVEPAAKSPGASLKRLQARPGFTVELIAAEPLVQDPIAFAWGPEGKLWVVEMGDYPLGVDGKGKPGGRVKYLESTKGDGKYDKATVFLDNLPFPTGVMPWRKGVLVTCAPEIFYAEDTKGTGKADLRVPLFVGFKEGNPQHRVNSLVWGLDNWIYCANGDSGGRVKSVKPIFPVAVLDIRGRDFRIRPDTGKIDAQTGQTQYGRSRDDWGNWFGCNNSNPMYHFVLADEYLRRNPHIAAPDPKVPVSVTPGAAQVFPISRTLPRFNDPKGANHFTSACSAIVYRDELFGPAFANSTFVSEPVHNLVHREIMTPQGVTFTSRRALDEQQSEFLASTDNWFRPTTIQTGPDGALWIADMYRHVIEHPEWIPKDWQKRLDLRAGHDKGRIYRVYPVGTQPRAIPRLDKLDAAGLVAALDSPNGWQRDTAQQMLLWRHKAGDEAAQTIRLLKKMVTDCERPLGRLSALCTLEYLYPISESIRQRALSDSHPGVRRHAIRVCEDYGFLAPAMYKLVTDPDPQVRLQLAYSLGVWNDDPRAGRALGELAVNETGDRYLSAAVMSSVNAKNLGAVLEAVMASRQGKAPPAALLENLVRLAFAFNDTKALATLLNALATPGQGRYAAWQFTALAGLLDALDGRNKTLATLKDEGGELRDAVIRLDGLFNAARAAVADPKASQTDQVLAVRLLGRGLEHQQDDLKTLAGLLVPQTAHEVQVAAVANLGQRGGAKVAGPLLAGWKGYSPALRSQVLETLFRRDDWLETALDAMEKKQVLALEFDASRRQRLLTHRTPGIRERAVKLFADAISPDRQKVLESYRAVLSMQGDAGRGAQVFGKSCATCHRFNNVGYEVGPDLASVGDKSPEGLLVAILDPNRAVEARYINYYATTKNGLTYSGVLTAETGTSITLMAPEGKKQVILRTELDTLTSTDKSAMPEGLEKDLKPQDVADVIAYVRAGLPQPKPKVFEGNKPELVRPGADGALGLLASNCEIYGPTLVLEKQHGNLGYWSSEDDRAVWTVDVPKPGKYTVAFDWACEDSAAGNTFALQAGLERLTGKVAGTGSWDVYRQARVGEIGLQAGRQQVSLRSDGKVTLAMMDLKSIKLVPIEKEK